MPCSVGNTIDWVPEIMSRGTWSSWGTNPRYGVTLVVLADLDTLRRIQSVEIDEAAVIHDARARDQHVCIKSPSLLDNRCTHLFVLVWLPWRAHRVLIVSF